MIYVYRMWSRCHAVVVIAQGSRRADRYVAEEKHHSSMY